MRLRVIVIVSVLAVILGGCAIPPGASSLQDSGQDAAAKIQVIDAWARAGAGAAAMGNGAAYMILRNNGDTADRLVKVESDVAGAVELHKSSMEGGMMKMTPVENIEVPAKGGQAELKPGGLHVMLIGLKRELRAGETIKLKLQFEKAGAQEVEVEVRKQ